MGNILRKMHSFNKIKQGFEESDYKPYYYVKTEIKFNRISILPKIGYGGYSNNLNVDISFDIEKLEKKFFNSLKFIKNFSIIDSENFLFDSLKEGKKILWCVLETPTNNIVGKYFFEEDAHGLADFQNKNRVWQNNGGIPRFLWNYIAGSYN